MPESPPAKPVVTRFAPSPTGHLHIGGARTALFCWAFARRHHGSFLIRIEDTDQARSSESSARGILEDLAWLGIDWDEGPALTHHGRAIGGDPRGVGPFFQSQRLDLYNRVADALIERGRAYADFTPPDALDALRKAAVAAKQTFKYRPPADQILPIAQQRERIRDGEPHVVRLRADDEPVRVIDDVLGEVAFAAGEIDDFVLRKADGFPTYHFGVVVDDELMGVTHVLRGQEHLMNTPRHVALQRALGYRTPAYAHMPLIFNDQGAKMSKRERDQTARAETKKRGLSAPPPLDPPLSADAFTAWLADSKRQLEGGQLEGLAAALGLRLPEVSVDDFRKAGYLPEVICNFIALLGWNPGALRSADGKQIEKFDMAFLAEHFDVQDIGKSNSRFDRAKLASFNQDALAGKTNPPMSDDDFARRWLDWCAVNAPVVIEKFGATDAATTARLAALVKAVRPRAKTFRDAVEVARFALTDNDALTFDQKAAEKALLSDDARGLQLLRDLAASGVIPSDPAAPQAPVFDLIKRWADERGFSEPQIAPALRVAATGSASSPQLNLTLDALGGLSLARRIERCLSNITR